MVILFDFNNSRTFRYWNLLLTSTWTSIHNTSTSVSNLKCFMVIKFYLLVSNKFHKHHISNITSRQNPMKNIEIFRTIQELLESKTEKQAPEEPSFAHNYCKQQIRKRKLIPHNPDSKMNHIMKNFHQLETYVNVQKLFEYINTLINEKKKEEIKSQTNIIWKSKKKHRIYEADIIEKAKEKLGGYYQQKHMKENEKAWQLLDKLQDNSTLSGYLKKNQSSHFEYQKLLKNIEKKQNKNEFNKSIEARPAWKYYYQNYDYEKNDLPRPITNKKKKENQTIKKTQEKTQLIHQVSTYLQMILENKHRKKWGFTEKEKKCDQLEKSLKSTRRNILRTSRSSFAGKKTLKIKIEDNTSQNQIKQEELGFESQSAHASFCCLKRKQSSTQQVKDNFTFRNRNIKQNLMKKLESFVDLVETEQKKFHKKNSVYINELNRIELKCRNNAPRNYDSIMAEDHEIVAVRAKVQQQK